MEQNPEMSKKAKEKQEKKYKRKVAQAQSTIVRAEDRPYAELISQEPKECMIIAHFGNGSEIDQNVLIQFCAEKGGEIKNLTIYPGSNYGHVEFKDVSSAEKLMTTAMDCTNCANIVFPESENITNTDRVVVFFYTPLKCMELKKSVNIEIADAEVAKTGSIPGLYVIDNFISEQEEKEMLQSIDKEKWVKLLNRRVQHYGYEFKYGTNNVDTNTQIGNLPSFCDPIMQRMTSALCAFDEGDKPQSAVYRFGEESLQDVYQKEDNKESDKQYFKLHGMFDQLTLNDYTPGQGIPPHVDTHSPFEEIFASLSLKSGVTMHFKKAPEDDKVVTKDLFLMPRQLIIFSGEVRYNWLHSIALRKIDRVVQEGPNKNSLLKFRNRRVSLTFRKVKSDGKPCECQWPKLCDSQNKHLAVVQENQMGGMDGETPQYNTNDEKPTEATNMEKEHVYDVYEKIAPHFSNTRYKPWPRVEQFMNDIPQGSFVADVGCGNGKYLGCNQENLFTVGTDRCFNFMNICKEKNIRYQAFVADSLRLPLRSQSVDRIISIAVVHHFSTDSLRIQAISEFHRIMRTGGQCLIYVWAYEQEHKKFQQQDVFVKWNLQDTHNTAKNKKQEEQKVNENQSVNSESQQTSFIETGLRDDAKKTTVYHRYYHMFMQGELEKLIQENFEGKLQIKESFFDHANWVVICEKLD